MFKKDSEDLGAIYERIKGQFEEDRTAVTEQYQDLKKFIKDNPDRYMTNGDTLAKYAELMIKQTAQIIELAKLASKQNKDDSSDLDEADLDFISDKIKDNE